MTTDGQDERTRTLERIFGAELAARYLDPSVTSETWLSEVRAALGLGTVARTSSRSQVPDCAT
jgi:hypothetical protein